MKIVAKLVIVDKNKDYLLLTLSNHPKFGSSNDLPGGTIEAGETAVEGLLREVREETGIQIDHVHLNEVYSGSEYSRHGTQYILFLVHVDTRPEVTLSWEHSTYEWVDKNEFIKKAKAAKDTYMHMVSDIVVAQAGL